MEDDTQLAIMSQPHFGMRDMSSPGFWFEVSFGKDLGSGALIVMNVATMVDQVMQADIYDIENLEGQPCQIRIKSGIVKFVKILKR